LSFSLKIPLKNSEGAVEVSIPEKQNQSQRKTLSDKKVRINVTTTEDTHRKLKKLAISCNMSKTALAEELLRMCLNHTDIIDWYQNMYNTEAEYRVIPVKQGNSIMY
jgi:flagellar basal body P-ring protein FlgI